METNNNEQQRAAVTMQDPETQQTLAPVSAATADNYGVRPGPLPRTKASPFKPLTQTEDGFLVDTYGRAYKKMRDGSIRKVTP